VPRPARYTPWRARWLSRVGLLAARTNVGAPDHHLQIRPQPSGHRRIRRKRRKLEVVPKTDPPRLREPDVRWRDSRFRVAASRRGEGLRSSQSDGSRRAAVTAAGQADRLRDILWLADRPLVLEVTEHASIEDYGRVLEIVRSLGNDIRLAVDDAEAGVVNFGHIVELGPDFVKLDNGFIRRVNGNLGRQALVVGMRQFVRTAGCRLIAQGIETEAEGRTLFQLSVEFGQGY
jgi:hypothetical protein